MTKDLRKERERLERRLRSLEFQYENSPWQSGPHYRRLIQETQKAIQSTSTRG